MERRALDVVVISDVHLGTYGCKAKELVAYLKSINPNILILNGDIIDGWQFSKRYFPPTHMAVIKEILNLMMRGTRVFYITGNHDEQLRKYTDFHLNNFTLTDKLVLEINNKMTWIFHGDVFDNTTKGSARFLAKLGSNGYGTLILFNRFVNFILKSLGKERISISKKVMTGFNKAMTKINDFEQIVTELAIEQKFDVVICGHIHLPNQKIVETNVGKVTYLNSGDWVEHLTSLEYNQLEWKVFTYNEKDFEHSAININSNPNVLTEEISYFINSLAI